MKIVGEEDFPYSVLQSGLEHQASTDEETVALSDEGCGNGAEGTYT